MMMIMVFELLMPTFAVATTDPLSSGITISPTTEPNATASPLEIPTAPPTPTPTPGRLVRTNFVDSSKTGKAGFDTPDAWREATTRLSGSSFRVAAYFVPELLDRLSIADRRMVSAWDATEVIRQTSLLSDGERQALNAVAPVAMNTYMETTDPQGYRQQRNAQWKSDRQSQTIDATETTFENEYQYKVDTDKLVDDLYHTANRQVNDLYLPGKTDLDLQFVRKYNSKDSFVLDPRAERRGNAKENNSALVMVQSDTGMIAAGWSLNMPLVRKDAVVEHTESSLLNCTQVPNPCTLQSGGYQTVYREITLTPAPSTLPTATPYEYIKLQITLDDGSAYEFRKKPGGSYKLYQYPYHNVTLIGSPDETFFSLKVSNVTYKFEQDHCTGPTPSPTPSQSPGNVLPPTPTPAPVFHLKTKTNRYNEVVSYHYNCSYQTNEYNVVITDSYGRKVTIERKSDPRTPADIQPLIVGIRAEDQGSVMKHIRYSVSRQAAVITKRVANSMEDDPHYQVETVGYWQLDEVNQDDGKGNQNGLESYSYYPVNTSTMADYNYIVDGMYYASTTNQTLDCTRVDQGCWRWEGSYDPIESTRIHAHGETMYGEVAYLLLKDIHYFNRLRVRFHYQTYLQHWDEYANPAVQEQFRGTTRLYVDREVLKYIGYHAVQRVDFVYEQQGNQSIQTDRYQNHHEDHGWTFYEIWKDPKRTNNRLSTTTRFGDVQTVSTSTQVGQLPSVIYHQYELMLRRQSGVTIADTPSTFLMSYAWGRTAGESKLVASEASKDQVTKYTYDSLYELPTLVERYRATVGDVLHPEQVTDPTQSISDVYRYDGYGYAIFHQNPKGIITETSYEMGDYHRPTSEVIRYGGGSNRLTSWFYCLPTDADVRKQKELCEVATTDVYPEPWPGESKYPRTRVTSYVRYDSNHQVAETKEFAQQRSVNIPTPQPTITVAPTTTPNPTVTPTLVTTASLDAGSETVTQFLYDSRGRLSDRITQVTLQSGNTPQPVTVSYGYDVNGNVIKTTYPDSGIETRDYDWMDRVTKVQFTPLNQAARITTIGYDDDNRTVTITQPDQMKQIMSYTPFGLLATSQQQVDQSVRMVTEQVSLDGEHVDISKPYGNLNFATRYSYDSDGQPISTVDALSRVTHYQYAHVQNGSMQDTVKVTLPDLKQETTVQNQFGETIKVEEISGGKHRITAYEYTVQGYLSKQIETDFENRQRVSTFSYDLDGQLAGMTAPDGTVYRYAYDRNGQMIRYAINGVWQTNHRTNELGWLLSETNPSGKVETYSYKKNGLLQTFVDRKSQTTTYSYTGYHEPLRTTIQDKNKILRYESINTYEDATRLLTKTQRNAYDSSGKNPQAETESFGYDQWKHLNVETVSGKSYRMQYDVYDRMTKLTYPQTTNETMLTVTYGYDNVGRMSSVNAGTYGKASYSYSTGVDQNTYRVDYNNGTYFENTRNGYGHLTNAAQGTVGQVTLSERETYVTDGFDNTKNWLINRNGTATSWDYTYDSMNRMLTEKKNSTVIDKTYTYDDKSNRKTLTGPSATPPPSAVRTAYSFSPANELVGFVKSDGTETTQATYSYYADGLRATKTVNGTKTRFVYLNGNILDELDGQGKLQARNIWGNELLLRKDAGAGRVGYYQYNGHGDVTRITDNTGILLKSYGYDGWGNLDGDLYVNDVKPFRNPYLYTGEYTDSESGLIYLRARYYDSVEGRFITEDSMDGDIKDPMTLNYYIYGGDNPVRYQDPTGNWFLDAVFLVMDVVQFVKEPSWENAAWIVGDMASFADPTGVISAAAHAAKAAKVVSATEKVSKALTYTVKNTTAIAKDYKAIHKEEELIEGSFKNAAFSSKQRKAEILAANKRNGKAAEKMARDDLIKEGYNIIGSQVSIMTSKGRRIVDHLVQKAGEAIKAIEVKFGNAKRSTKQLEKDVAMEKGAKIENKNLRNGINDNLGIKTEERRYFQK